MNFHQAGVIPGTASPCVFSAGDFVRVRGTEDVGRVTEVAENEDYPIPYTVCVFGDTNTERDFASGQLEVWSSWTVQPLDLKKANERLMRIVALSDLVESLGKLEMASRDANDLLPGNLLFISSVLADTVCDLLDMVSDEERRQRQAA